MLQHLVVPIALLRERGGHDIIFASPRAFAAGNEVEARATPARAVHMSAIAARASRTSRQRT
jgi:hypothetical protein